MAKIKIEIPDEIAHHSGDIQRFVDQMIHKLWVHRNKGSWETLDTYETMQLLLGEVSEVEDAIEFGTLLELKDELADVANYCMIYHAIISGIGHNHRHFQYDDRRRRGA